MALPTALLVKAAASRGCARHLAGTRVTPYTDSPVAKGYSPGRVRAANKEQRAIAPAGVPGSIFSPGPPVSRGTIVQSRQLTSSIGTAGPSGRRAALTGPRACPGPPPRTQGPLGTFPGSPRARFSNPLALCQSAHSEIWGRLRGLPGPPAASARPRAAPGVPPGARELCLSSPNSGSIVRSDCSIRSLPAYPSSPLGLTRGRKKSRFGASYRASRRGRRRVWLLRQRARLALPQGLGLFWEARP